MIRGTRNLAWLGLICAGLPAAHAVENGAPITPFGVFDFGAGMLPPPSEYGTVGLRVAHYAANQLRDDAGDRSPVAARVRVTSVGAAFIKMTDITLGSAKFGWGGVLPYLDTLLNLAIPTPVGPLNLAGKNRAQGDVQLIPAILQWTPSPGLFTNVQLQLQMPTGSYDKDRLINAGTHHWTVSPAFAFTYIQPSGLELSSFIQLNINGRNKATDYRSGLEYQHEFAAGMHSGPWTWGLGGYWYQQLTDDKAHGQTVDNSRARALAIGPVLNFFELGSGMPIVWVHAYKEVSARNRSQGSQLAVRAAWTF